MSAPVFQNESHDVMRDSLERDGYLVLEDALRRDEVEAILREATRICRGELGAILGAEANLGDLSEDELLVRYLCIHHPHKLSTFYEEMIRHPVIVDALTALIGPNVKCMQSMLFIKSAGKPGQAWHQDEDFIPTRDRSLLGAWIALDDATTENGCLWVIPGSHKHGVLWELRDQDDPDFDCVAESVGFPYTDDDAVPVELTSGSMVFFNGYLLHRSLPNRSTTGYRRSLVNHYMSAESLLPWGENTKGTGDYRDIVMVTGTDPYAYKGFEKRAQTHIRPDGLGGCQWPHLPSTRSAQASTRSKVPS